MFVKAEKSSKLEVAEAGEEGSIHTYVWLS
jgi:hypothetical protein